MIRVQPQAEPADFDRLVRVPGRAFLATTPNPSSKQFENAAYWRRILKELRTAYGKVCAYSCFYIPEATGVDTVEHFLPKVPHPAEAYEWTNYRFVSHRLNQRKGKKEDVVDPFAIQNGWFVIDFPSLLVRPADNLAPDITAAVQGSIDRLGLNDSDSCWEQRDHFTRAYCLGKCTFAYLQQDAPFLASEIARQGLVQELPAMMGYDKTSAEQAE